MEGPVIRKDRAIPVGRKGNEDYGEVGEEGEEGDCAEEEDAADLAGFAGAFGFFGVGGFGHHGEGAAAEEAFPDSVKEEGEEEHDDYEGVGEGVVADVLESFKDLD